MSEADATPSSSVTDDTGSSHPAGDSLLAGGRSDRILGFVCLAIAVWYSIQARTFDGTAFSSGPVGPKTLPTGIGVVFAALSVFLIVKPERVQPRRSSNRARWQLGLVLACSYAYGQLIEPVGFIAASAAMTMVLGLLFRAPVRRLLPLSVAFPVVVAFVFDNWLKLRLPAGWWGGF